MDAALVAYPTLLAACYGIHRIGTWRRPSPIGIFDVAHLATHGIVLGITLAVTVRFVTIGQLPGQWGGVAAACAVVALGAIIGVDAYHAFRRAQRAHAEV